MEQEILSNVVNTLQINSPEYINSISNTISNYINYTQIPSVFLQTYIDLNYLPKNIKEQYINIENIIDNKLNILARCETFKDCGFITAMFVQKYLTNTLIKDSHINTILYIDTYLLIQDYKKLMDKNSETETPILVHSLDVLNEQIQFADYVFWDKFSMLQSNYDFMKIYDIISVRYRNCLGNWFFVDSVWDKIAFQELNNVMNISNTIDLEQEQYKYLKRS